MKNLKRGLLRILIITPLTAFAHGEDVLYTLALYVISTIIFIVLVTLVKLRGAFKAVITFSYIIAMILVFLFASVVPYKANRDLINNLAVIVPFLVAALVFIFLKSKSDKIEVKKEKTNY